MKAYLVHSDRRIEPFGDHPGDCLIANDRLGHIQENTLAGLGIPIEAVSTATQIADEGEHLVLSDTLFFTKELVADFILKSQAQRGPTVCSVKPSVATARAVIAAQDVMVKPDRIEFFLRYLPPVANRDQPERPVILTIDESESIPIPEHMIGGPGGYQVPMTPKLILQVDHWANLWGANIAWLLAESARLLSASKMRQIGLAFKARSTNPWKVMQRTNKIGRNCDIHPTAYIEGSTIGDNVTVGAKTTVRESIVGDGTYLGDNSTVHLSVLGEGCNLQSGSLTEFCVLYPGVCSNDRIIAISMVGRDCFIAGNVIFTNFRLDKKNIMIKKGPALVDSGNRFLGSCVGHNVYLGAGCVIAPGRTIPNGTRLAPEENHVIRSCVDGEEVPGYRRILA